jgi:hypothetical protein
MESRICVTIGISGPAVRSNGLNDRFSRESWVEIVESGYRQILESVDAVGAGISTLVQMAY